MGYKISDLHKYLDMAKVFLKGAHTVEDCANEFIETQKLLAELFEMKYKVKQDLITKNTEFDKSRSESRITLVKAMEKLAVKPTEKLLESKMILADKFWFDKKQDIEHDELILDIIENLIMLYMQRKSIIQELISSWKFKQFGYHYE